MLLAFILGAGVSIASYEVWQPAWLTSHGPGKLNVCFTPQGKCADLIINEINKAQVSIKLQAYSFTSYSIMQALLGAHKRGVEVKVILDKSNLKDPHSLLSSLKRASIPVFIDFLPGIAHNKVIILDNNSVLTGSFNFTNAAQNRNAENLVFIQDQTLADHYVTNWLSRLEKAKKYL